MSKYKVAWSKTYHVSGEVEIEAVSEAHAVQRVEDEMGGYEGSMQYDPKYDYIEVVEGEIPSLVKYEEMEQITREMAEEILDKARELGALSYPRDFDGAHHVAESRKDLPYDAMGDYSNIEPNKAQERLDKFNKDNPTDNLQDLI